MKVRSAMIAEDITQQLIAKQIEEPYFALQFEETTDIANHARLIIYCLFSNKSVDKFVQHFLCCLPIG